MDQFWCRKGKVGSSYMVVLRLKNAAVDVMLGGCVARDRDLDALFWIRDLSCEGAEGRIRQINDSCSL